jgi:maltose/maltodextrin transport system substrate-binding protein
MYAGQSPRPGDAAEAVQVARRAADFLIGMSGAAGTPLESMPPTYHGAKPTEREDDRWTMMMSPAEAGQGYLDLYDVTRNAKYLEAARRIAGTYGKLQNAAGTWALKVDNRTGEPLAPLELVPAVVISFLDRLVVQYGVDECRGTRDRAVRWMMEHPVRTFDWQAQFDDAKLRGAYENLAKHEACEFATYLFRHAKEGPRNVEVATELLRFAEDQFVTWECPPEIPPRVPNMDPKGWITPCSTEQYAMFEPISGSSAFMIVAYFRAYEATGDELHLAKARALANGLTVAQRVHKGRYPTRMVREDLAYWVNSTVNTVRAMRLLAEVGEPESGGARSR